MNENLKNRIIDALTVVIEDYIKEEVAKQSQGYVKLEDVKKVITKLEDTKTNCDYVADDVRGIYYNYVNDIESECEDKAEDVENICYEIGDIIDSLNDIVETCEEEMQKGEEENENAQAYKKAGEEDTDTLEVEDKDLLI